MLCFHICTKYLNRGEKKKQGGKNSFTKGALRIRMKTRPQETLLRIQRERSQEKRENN